MAKSINPIIVQEMPQTANALSLPLALLDLLIFLMVFLFNPETNTVQDERKYKECNSCCKYGFVLSGPKRNISRTHLNDVGSYGLDWLERIKR